MRTFDKETKARLDGQVLIDCVNGAVANVNEAVQGLVNEGFEFNDAIAYVTQRVEREVRYERLRTKTSAGTVERILDHPNRDELLAKVDELMDFMESKGFDNHTSSAKALVDAWKRQYDMEGSN